jgi:hypothetical protein
MFDFLSENQDSFVGNFDGEVKFSASFSALGIFRRKYDGL